MSEIWKPVVGYEGRYEVSNLGNVRSFVRRHRIGEPHPLKPGIGSTGYYLVALHPSSIPGQRQQTHKVAGLVMAAFVGPRPEGYQIDHLNANKLDNRLENLEYVSPKENTGRAWRMGLAQPGPSLPGERSPSATISEATALAVIADRAAGMMPKAIADKRGLTRSTVSHIVYGHSWKHLNRPSEEVGTAG